MHLGGGEGLLGGGGGNGLLLCEVIDQGVGLVVFYLAAAVVRVELVLVVLLLVLNEVVQDDGKVLGGALVDALGHQILPLEGGKGLFHVQPLLLGHLLIPVGVLWLWRLLREVVHRCGFDLMVIKIIITQRTTLLLNRSSWPQSYL